MPYIADRQPIISVFPSGGDDTAAIQAALNALPATGGQVLLSAGTYLVSAPLTIGTDNVTFGGLGRGNPFGSSSPNPIRGGTRLLLASGFSGTKAIDVEHASRALTGITLRDFTIDGVDKTSGSVDGIYFQAYRSTIRDVRVTKMSGNGLHIHSFAQAYPGGAFDNQIICCTFDNNTGNGIRFTNYASDNLFNNVIVQYNASDGIYIDSTSASNKFELLYCYTNTGKSVLADTAYQLKFWGCRFQDCNGGVYLTAVTGFTGFNISGCAFRDCSNTTDNTTDGINVTAPGTSYGGIISACDFGTDPGDANPNRNKMRYCVNIASANLIGVTIGPLTFERTPTATGTFGTAAIQDLGTGTHIVGVPGWTAQTPDHRVGFYLRDDFFGGGASTGVIGEHGWSQSGGTYAAQTAVANHPGFGRLDTTASSGTVAMIRLGNQNQSGVLPADFFDVTFLIRLNTNDTNVAIRAGLTNDSLTAPPSGGIFIEKSFADTQWFGVARAGGSQTRTAALASVDTNWVRLRCRRVDASNVGFSLNDGTELTVGSNIPTGACTPWVQITNNAAASKTCDVDYFEMTIARMVR